MAKANYQVRKVRAAKAISADQLPTGNLDLYTCESGIGTGDELRALVAEGIIPADSMFTLEYAA